MQESAGGTIGTDERLPRCDDGSAARILDFAGISGGGCVGKASSHPGYVALRASRAKRQRDSHCFVRRGYST